MNSDPEVISFSATVRVRNQRWFDAEAYQPAEGTWFVYYADDNFVVRHVRDGLVRSADGFRVCTAAQLTGLWYPLPELPAPDALEEVDYDQ
ncbi:MAG: hypothetical protein E1N59_2854 [Puniceicoccaceae bacterium 5H]|nr:MAG: hypothetical protein E1N59_2854 [Puniceicoccaceae bacterium 5H]